MVEYGYNFYLYIKIDGAAVTYWLARSSAENDFDFFTGAGLKIKIKMLTLAPESTQPFLSTSETNMGT